MTVPLVPPQASSAAASVDALYAFLTATSFVFVVLIFGPIAYCMYRYRRGHTADRTPLGIPTMRIEVTWTIVPLFLAMGMFVWGARSYFDMERPPADALEIHVVGKQWMWKLQHPEGIREINELHVPVNRDVKLVLASEDVIHSFFVPAFRVKQDAVPGRFTTEWFRPVEVGDFHLFCAEYCGTDHSRMVGTIHVMSGPNYAGWLAGRKSGDTLAQQGARRFREFGCSGCHLGSPAVHAPRLQGLYGRPVPLADGQIVTADERYLRDSILLPQKEIAAGYEPIMPTFQGRIGEDELFELIAYIKSEAGDRGPASP